MTHLLSVSQFDTEGISRLFQLAHELETGERSVTLSHQTVCTNLFYEPSTRTSTSFASAMMKLGGNVINITDVNFSSVSKGETLEDTVRVISGYSDVVVLRHPEVGAAMRAASVSPVPIINGGDGVGEHPTQALLDLYTIHKQFGLDRRLKIALVGDLRHGRTVHSLLRLLRMYDVEIHLVAPTGFEMPSNLVKPSDIHHKDLWGCIQHVNVIYMTRVQKERIADPQLLNQIGNYKLDLEMMHLARKDMIVMHPLPRVDEIDPLVDADPRAKYFEQSRNGLVIRQAIFLNILSPRQVCWQPAIRV